MWTRWRWSLPRARTSPSRSLLPQRQSHPDLSRPALAQSLVPPSTYVRDRALLSAGGQRFRRSMDRRAAYAAMAVFRRPAANGNAAGSPRRCPLAPSAPTGDGSYGTAAACSGARPAAVRDTAEATAAHSWGCFRDRVQRAVRSFCAGAAAEGRRFSGLSLQPRLGIADERRQQSARF